MLFLCLFPSRAGSVNTSYQKQAELILLLKCSSRTFRAFWQLLLEHWSFRLACMREVILVGEPVRMHSFLNLLLASLRQQPMHLKVPPNYFFKLPHKVRWLLVQTQEDSCVPSLCRVLSLPSSDFFWHFPWYWSWRAGSGRGSLWCVCSHFMFKSMLYRVWNKMFHFNDHKEFT